MPVQRNPALGSYWSGAVSGASLLQGASEGTGTEQGHCTQPLVYPGGDKITHKKLQTGVTFNVHSSETW